MSRNLISREPDPSKRGSAVVCIPVVAYDDETVATVCGVLAHTETSVPILLIGARALLEALGSRLPEAPHAPVLFALMRDGEAAAFNAAVQAVMPGDLVLVRAGVLVAEGWLERLQAAAYSDTTVASATPLTLASAATEVASSDRRASLAGVASTVAERSLRLRPKIAAMGPKCLYVRRSALDLAARLQEEAGIEVGLEALTLELLELGMVHVLADDVVVEAGGGDVAGGSPVASSGNEASVADTLGSDDHGSLRRALNHTRIALRRMSVTIDGRALSPAVGGTQTYVIALILGLARVTEIDLRVLVPSDLSQRAGRALASVPAVSTISIEEALGEPKPSDVVHRPQQVFTPDDMLLLRRLGLRLIVGQQDLIAYHNPSYHRDLDTWRAYRRTTRLALAGADQAIFFSEHARGDALREDLLGPARGHVVGIGAEPIERLTAVGSRPVGIPEDPFLLCLGADYAHKNRPFAIKLVGALRELGWKGRLVLAGPHVPAGSSRVTEAALLENDVELSEAVIDVGAVDEPTRAWLVDRACALLYPTLYEGFGLLPLEAARAGVPCLFAAQASLEELAADAATLIPWDAAASAAAVLDLLVEGPSRRAHLDMLAALECPGWSEIVEGLVAVYQYAIDAPASEAAPRIWQELEREGYVASLESLAQQYQDAYHSLEARVRTGLPLIDEGGLLSPDEQRGLMRLAARGRLGRALMSPLGLVGRVRGSE